MTARLIMVAECLALAAAVSASGASAAAAAAAARSRLSYTSAQVAAGKRAYQQSCASCHGAHLTDGQFGPPLRGQNFMGDWAGQPVAKLYDFMREKMPPGAVGTISGATDTRILAYLLSQNHVGHAGAAPLPSAQARLMALTMPGRRVFREGAPAGPGGGLAPGVKLPPWPAPPNPLEHYAAVTEQMLEHPGDEWLTWRRSYAEQGFSPLAQVNAGNVHNLRLAWVQTLPGGPNEGTPLEHNGVLFVHAFGDHVLAIDAASGRLLWQYARPLPEGARPATVRNMALYGNRLYVPATGDRMIALDARTGKVDWDVQFADPKKGYGVSGGPLVAQGVVMQGTAGRAPGGNYIAGLDARTGKQLWRLYDIPQPGDPNERTWNDTPLSKRNGGSIWTAGSYDPQLKLAFFGTGNTYDTAPLVNRKLGYSNAGLYLDSTLAVDPATGRRVWYFQHEPNDQWDYDWAFTRQIVTLPVAGIPTPLVFTMGKPAVGDALVAATGKYVFSIDLGLQNFITAINPETGAKTYDPKLYPNGKAFTICPHAGAAKSWIPGSYDPRTHIEYQPLVKSCMRMIPVAKGERGALSSGYRWAVMPWPGSRGRYGRVEAINLLTRQPVWKVRQRAPQTSGVLATAGGVVFAGALDSYFTAYDAATGKQLWTRQLGNVPSSAPISYMIDGREYVAVVVGYGGAQAVTFPPLVPEIKLPAARSSSIFVFELPKQ